MQRSVLLLFPILAAQAYSQPITVTVTASPASAFVLWGRTLPMTATITNAPPTNMTLNWSILPGGLGTLSAFTGSSVTYIAPSNYSVVTVTIVQVTSAADPTKFANVVITLAGDNEFANIPFVTTLYSGGGCPSNVLPNPPGGFFGRLPDAPGLAYWLNQLDSPILRAQMVLDFFNSPEFQQNGAAVMKTYIGALGRDPDFSGFSYWRQASESGALATPACLAGPPPNNTMAFCSEQTLVNVFITSPEFTGTYGSLNNAQFVNLVYQHMLARSVDPNGLNYWTGQLNAGLTRAQMMQAFIDSLEFSTLVSNRLLADTAYLALLDQTPDYSGAWYWTNQLNQGTSVLQFINAFITSTAFIGKFC